MIYYPNRAAMIKDLPPLGVGCEVGVQAGEFSSTLLQEATPKELYLVDCWKHQDGGYELDPANVDQAKQNALYESVCKRFDHDERVTIIRDFSHKAVKRLPRLDWVYLDANHTYDGLTRDLFDYAEIISNDGVIMGHDFIDNGPARKMGFGVVKAVEAFCALAGWKITGLTIDEWTSYRLERK